MNKNYNKQVFTSIFLGALFLASPASAQTLSDFANNIMVSFTTVPGPITAGAYLLGLLFAVTGILELIKHVESPTQTPLKKSVIRFIVGGMLFALPAMYQAMKMTFDQGGGDVVNGTSPFALLSLFFDSGEVDGGGDYTNINDLFRNIVASVTTVPGLVALVSYLSALVIGVQGILKIKDHVDNPDQTTMKEPLVRLLIAGALFAMPALAAAAYNFFGLTDTGLTTLTDGEALMLSADPSINDCDQYDENTFGNSICRLTGSVNGLPALLAGFSYIAGIVFVVWGIFKIRDHVLNPTQVGVWEGIARFFAGGAFLALPIVIYAIRSSLLPDEQLSISTKVSGYNHGDGSPTCGADIGGLDVVLHCMMADIYGPINVAIVVFSILAGIIFIMIGISRLIKGAQEGAKGPGGLGTIMTFVAGAALLSSNALVKTFSMSMFGDEFATTYADLAYREGMTDAEVSHVVIVISAILKFLVIIGFISFVRGIFIVRGVAEGNQNSSMMAGITHMVGGALAVNLGPVLAAIQTTLGLYGQYGIAFS